MKKIFSVIVGILLAAVFTVSPTALAQANPYDDAMKVYEAKNYPKAFEMFKKLADQGDAEGQCALGLMYREGEGVAQDYKEAIKWFRKAADQGCSNAQVDLGTMYEKGYGVT